jgi:transketolase
MSENYQFVPGMPVQVSQGSDITIVALGTAVHDVLEAGKNLNRSCSMDIFVLSSVRPLEPSTILESIRKTGKILTVEQHSTHGGCGSLMAELIADNGLGARLLRLGIPEGSFTKNALPDLNKQFFGLDPEGISLSIKKLLKN